MGELLEEVILEGAPISGGVAFGTLFFLEGFHEEIIPEFSISLKGIEKEIGRYRRAVLSSREDLHDLQRFLAKEGSTEAVSIIDTHIQMLEDPFMTTFMEKTIRKRMKNTETVFRSVMYDYEKQFAKMKDTFFEQRLCDVKDLSQRILRNLYPRKIFKHQAIPENSIIFTKELVPSSIAEASKGEVKGFITEIGGSTSHAALIARSKGIPYVANVSTDILYSMQSSPVVIDGRTGIVIVHPSEETQKKYKEKQKAYEKKKNPVRVKAEMGTHTIDGVKIDLLANIENLSDLDHLHEHNAEGIGLFRSEFLFFGKELDTFSEEDQFVLYQQVMDKARGMPVVFRVFDVGGDKGNVRGYETEPNPALGCRGIRFLLQNRDVFIQQVRALLRVSPDGNLRILLPMISDVNELLTSKALICEMAHELVTEGHEISDDIPIGCMIEVPSAVVLCDHLARECDFLSIGTNDLMQYTLAADRGAQETHSFYKPTHPSILRMIKQVVDAAALYDVPVSLCGEMAALPELTPLLLGLGIRKFSCASRFLPEVKEKIEGIAMSELHSLTNRALALPTVEEIEALLKSKG